MSDMNGFYRRFSDDDDKKKKKIYSPSDYIAGAKGVLAKLAVSFIISVIALSFYMVALSAIMYLNEMFYIALHAFLVMTASWGSSVFLKGRANIIKLAAPLLIIIAMYFLSPYVLWLKIVCALYFAIVSLILLSRLNLPERISFSGQLVVISCIAFCIYQVMFFAKVFNTASAVSAKPFFMTFGIVWIIISLFALNLINFMENSSRKITKAMIWGNITLTSVFAGMVLIISGAGAYKEFILSAVRKIILFLFSANDAPEEAPIASTPQGGGVDLSQLGEEGKTSVFWDILEKIAFVLAAIIAAALIFLLIRAIIKALKKLMLNVSKYLKDKEGVPVRESYDDKEESIFDSGQFSENVRKRLDAFAQRFKRKPKYSDMKDNRQRARFIYKKILNDAEKKEHPAQKGETAREYIIDTDATIIKETFVNGYEKARYSSHSVSDEEVQAGLEIAGKKI